MGPNGFKETKLWGGIDQRFGQLYEWLHGSGHETVLRATASSLIITRDRNRGE
jgi:hypothetical protein